MLAKRALLVIDVQQAFCEGEHEAFQIAQVIERINAMADKARRANAPIVFIQHESKEGLLRQGSRGWQLAAGLVVGPHDVVLTKSTPDSFLRTELTRFLEEHGVKVVADVALKLNGHEFAAITPRRWLELARQHMRDDADGVFLSCTNTTQIEAIEDIELALGKPVVNSNQAVLWGCVQRLGAKLGALPPMPALGKLMAS